MAINDEEKYPISDTEVAELKQEATKRLSDLPAQLQQMCIGSTWRRSAEQSMMEYQLPDMAAQSIEILKAMNIMGKEQLQRKAERGRQEAAPGVLKAINYGVCPEEIAKTRNDLRNMWERGCSAWVEECAQHLTDGVNISYYTSCTPTFLIEMEHIEWTMDKVRSTGTDLKADNPNGYRAIELLDFYSDAWTVWLDEIYLHIHDWYEDVYYEKMDGAKQRVNIAEEIIREVEKERRKQMRLWGMSE